VKTIELLDRDAAHDHTTPRAAMTKDAGASVPDTIPEPRAGLVLLQRLGVLPFVSALLASGCGGEPTAYSAIEPRVIELELPAENDRPGGLITADVNDDGRRDFVITKPGHVATYDGAGGRLWSLRADIRLTGKSEEEGLPGLHAAGVQAADVDGDGKTEVLLLASSGALRVLEGATGEAKHTVTLSPPRDAERWEHLVVADFRGGGDRDLVLQATNADGYRMGRHVAAYALDRLLEEGDTAPLWTRDDFVAAAHSGARVTDLDGDGRDEVLGATLVSPEGELLFSLPVPASDPGENHVDSVFVADVRPDISGLEVVALEEGGDNRIFLFNPDGLIWQAHNRHREPQNAAIGEFDPAREGLEVWCRSRNSEHQEPWAFDARGRLIAEYEMDDVAPGSWTESGVEVIFTIDWAGGPKQLAAAKERHESGDVAIFDPLTGEFLHVFEEEADRLYVADVSGDWREELIVLNGNRLHIYENTEPNPNPDRPPLWSQDHYRRSKATWNYYNP
jgi:hypothetical protein